MGASLVEVLLSALLTTTALLFGRGIVQRWSTALDPAARIGLYGLVGMGVFGSLIYLFGLLTDRWSILLVALSGLALFLNLPSWRKKPFSLQSLGGHRPSSSEGALALLGILIAVLFALSGVLTPSTSLDWDTLAYHLAVPKIWIAAGRIESVSFIHHSNFPAAADALFLIGLKISGGQAGAKAFMLFAYLFGILAVFGLARGRYGERGGWFAGLLFAAVPMAMWEAGSAYIDLIHGLYAGLGLWLLADDSEKATPWPLPAILIGLAMGTKYTGLQVLLVGLVITAVGMRRRELSKISAVALLVGGFWYVKNWIVVGNPVYPFYYGLLGGRNWDTFAATIYAEEQATFGMGRGPGALLGLAAAPGRFTNPGPTAGLGFIFVSLGAAGLASLLGWGFSPSPPRIERRALLAAGLMLGIWLLVSQQSRYILQVLPIMAILGGGLAASSVGWRAVIALNAVLGLFVFSRTLLPERMPYLSGGLTEAEYLGGFASADGSRVPGKVSFYEPSRYLNEAAKGGKVALYDELFGYFLDVPYVWAGPGHSTEIDYATMETGTDLVRSLGHLGVSHVYLNFIGPMQEPANVRFAEALGLTAPPRPYTTEESASMTDPRAKWKRLFAEAVASGGFTPDRSFGRRQVYRLAR